MPVCVCVCVCARARARVCVCYNDDPGRGGLVVHWGLCACLYVRFKCACTHTARPDRAPERGVFCLVFVRVGVCACALARFWAPRSITALTWRRARPLTYTHARAHTHAHTHTRTHACAHTRCEEAEAVAEREAEEVAEVEAEGDKGPPKRARRPAPELVNPRQNNVTPYHESSFF